MLPYGTVHLKRKKPVYNFMNLKKIISFPVPNLNKVCKKLGIDCASAIVGFDFHGGWSHPVYNGFVVCKEFEEVVTEAWFQEEEEQEKKETEKREKRIYGNWKKLIKGLLIKARLQAKYNFENEESDIEEVEEEEEKEKEKKKPASKTRKK